MDYWLDIKNGWIKTMDGQMHGYQKQMDGWMDKKQMDGWMDKKTHEQIDRYKNIWMVECIEKKYEKKLDGWMDRKNRMMVGWI